jgi:hypothetical protein
MLNNYNIQTGYLFDENNKKFDVSVILNFPTEADYENCTGLDDFPSVNLIDFYFGEPNDRDTETYLKQFIEKQNKLLNLYIKLIALHTVDPDDNELAEQIEFVRSLIVELH